MVDERPGQVEHDPLDPPVRSQPDELRDLPEEEVGWLPVLRQVDGPNILSCELATREASDSQTRTNGPLERATPGGCGQLYDGAKTEINQTKRDQSPKQGHRQLS